MPDDENHTRIMQNKPAKLKQDEVESIPTRGLTTFTPWESLVGKPEETAPETSEDSEKE